MNSYSIQDTLPGAIEDSTKYRVRSLLSRAYGIIEKTRPEGETPTYILRNIHIIKG